MAFSLDRYIVLKSFLKQPRLSLHYRYALQLFRAGAMLPDVKVGPNAFSVYGDFMMEGLLIDLLTDVEHACGLRLYPTFSYLRVYKQGAILRTHTDLPSCEIR